MRVVDFFHGVGGRALRGEAPGSSRPTANTRADTLPSALPLVQCMHEPGVRLDARTLVSDEGSSSVV
jgi:hypothetical protein